MKQTRRQMLSGTAATLAGVALGSRLVGAVADARKSGLKFSMCDWSMGCNGEVKAIELADKIGLDGVQVSFGKREEPFRTQIRDPEVQKAYLAAARKHNITINSLGMGILNTVPLKSEPHTALWVADALDAAINLGAKNVLLAFFSKGQLDEKNEKEIQRVTQVVKELAPRAEKAGVVLGLENTISAEANLNIIEQCKSKYVQVYYDVYNMQTMSGKDPIKEIKLLGKENICEIHFKEGRTYLGQSGKIDWKAVVDMLNQIGYNNWITLETSSPSKNIIADAQKNVKFIRNLYAK